MDELSLLRDFRLEDAAAADARDRVRAQITATVRRRRRRRRFVVAAALVASALAITGATYAIAQALHVGDPAPKEVREQGIRFGHSAELIPVPHPDDPQLEDATVVALLNSSAGTVYMFGSSNNRGPCASVWLDGDRGYQGRLNLTTSCGASGRTMFAYGGGIGPQDLSLFFGRAGNAVTRVAVTVNHRSVNVPLTGRWFLAEIPTRPTEVSSYTADGRRLERHKLPPRPLPGGRVHRPPHQVTRAHQQAQITARERETITLFVARASDGGYCQIVRSDRRPSNRGCSVNRPQSRAIDVAA